MKSVAALVLFLAGCSSTPVTEASQGLGPGSKALLSDTVACSATADCAAGEQCLDGTCQIQRCAAATYHSASPLGTRSYFALDRELAVVDGNRGIDGYEPVDGSFAHPGTLHLDFGGVTILDEAGGNFTGTRPEGVAVAIRGKTSVVVTSGAGSTEVPVGFEPVAVAAGDADGDGVDDLVALSAKGDVAVCNVKTSKCTTIAVGGTGKDVAMGDVDGDGIDEPVALVDVGGSSHVVVLNLDAATTAQPARIDLDTGHTAMRVTAGDIDHVAPAEIITLEDGGYLGWMNDTVRVFAQKETSISEIGSLAPASDTLDLVAGDIDGDGKDELLVLEGSGVEVIDATTPNAPRSSFKTTLSSSIAPTRIALADLDGDSPVGTLQGNPELVAGPVVPVSVLVYPPYSTSHSDGTGEIGLGNTESKNDTSSTTVTLNAAFVLGFDAEIPGIAKIGIQAGVNASMARTSAQSHTVSVGDKFSVSARPDLEGPDNGVAVLACACYHAYTYTIDDPARKLGAAADRKTMSLFVPVGGQTAVWSLKRYNALATRLGNLPTVTVPYIVGDPKSYPTKMSTLAGKAIPEEDMLFTTPKSYRTSDVAKVGWSLSVNDGVTNATSRTLGVSLRGILKAGPVVAETTVGASSTTAYSVTVGKEASFSGSVPPIRNSVRTPEDENALYGFGFSPIVYREHYTTKDGNEGGLYVVTYSVTP